MLADSMGDDRSIRNSWYSPRQLIYEKTTPYETAQTLSMLDMIQTCSATPSVLLPPLKATNCDLKKMSPNICKPDVVACRPPKQATRC